MCYRPSLLASKFGTENDISIKIEIRIPCSIQLLKIKIVLIGRPFVLNHVIRSSIESFIYFSKKKPHNLGYNRLCDSCD